jgi:hypothetical protein
METRVFKQSISAIDGKDSKADKEQIDSEKLYAQIGQLKVENDFLKKN